MFEVALVNYDVTFSIQTVKITMSQLQSIRHKWCVHLTLPFHNTNTLVCPSPFLLTRPLNPFNHTSNHEARDSWPTLRRRRILNQTTWLFPAHFLSFFLCVCLLRLCASLRRFTSSATLLCISSLSIFFFNQNGSVFICVPVPAFSCVHVSQCGCGVGWSRSRVYSCPPQQVGHESILVLHTDHVYGEPCWVCSRQNHYSQPRIDLVLLE